MGLYIYRPSENDVGLFSNVDNTSMYSFGLVDVNISGGTSVGALIGDAVDNDVTVSNVFATGKVSGTVKWVA